jgi:hypothetical protein
MTQVAEKLVREYESLPANERDGLLAELLRRAAFEPHDLPADDDLVAAADYLFQELDRREQPQ